MDSRVQSIAESAGGLVLLRRARADGVPAGVLRWAEQKGALVRIASGAFVDRGLWERSTPRARHELALRAAIDRSPRSVAAGMSAAVLWGLPLPTPVPLRPVLLTARTATRPQHGTVTTVATARRAWLVEEEVTLVRGMRVTVPERTFVDLARHLTLPWSLAVADSVRHLHQVSRHELLAAVARNVCAPGHARAHTAASHAENLVESPLESLGRGVQIELGLPVPQVQAWVGEQRPEFRVDMLVTQHATVVEADGRVKYDGPDAPHDRRWQDKRRQDRLLDLGYDCHRFVAADTSRPTAWGRELLRTFARSHARRGLPVPSFVYPWA